MPQVQNEIEGMQRNFSTFWMQHPVILLSIRLFPVILVAIPLLAISLCVIDPRCPMFVVTSALFTKAESSVNVYDVGKLAIWGLIEALINLNLP